MYKILDIGYKHAGYKYFPSKPILPDRSRSACLIELWYGIMHAMGKLETISQRQTRKTYIQKALLSFLREQGLWFVTAFGPSAYHTFRIGTFDRVKKKYDQQTIKRSFYRLLDAGYINMVQTRSGKRTRLTKEGEQYLRKLELNDFALKRPKKWDKKYRLVIFDIKEGRRIIRQQLRQTLRTIGFLRLQNSVWVYPYDCEDLIVMLKADFRIGREVLYLIVDQIEGDDWIKKHFGII